MAAVSCCDWSSTACFVQWALGASWSCTPSTFLERKRGGGNSMTGKKKKSVYTNREERK